MSDESQVPAATAAPAAPETLKTEPAKVNPEELFARKEKQLRRMQQQLQQEKQAMEAKLKGYETDYVPKSRIKEDPITAMMEAGYSHEEIYQRLLNSTPNTDPTIKAMENKIKALEDRLANGQKQAEESTQQQYQQAVKQIDREIKLMVDSDNEFETIKASEAHSAVTELIEQTYKDEGYLMDIKEAARQVENYLVEQGLKMAQLNKVKSKLQPTVEEIQAKPTTKAATTTVTPKTLTNNMQQEPQKRTSEKERMARALAAFKGQ
jgi:antitoxin component HigA of HigAB toxin-antitoxin module